MIGVPIEIGEVVAGTYCIEGMLGEGAMGMVTVARHQTLGHRVAIKFLHPHIARQSHAAERFRREARMAASIRGAHTCRVLDVGTHGNGLPYLVMEHLDGHTLADELQLRGLLPYREAVGYVLQACEGLAEAHARGIVHRDIKPANLFLETRVDGTRSIKVLDFGVSKSLAATVGRLTTSMNLLGSPLYCSPEHLRSARDLDARSDIWSLGVVLYELITGLLPFDADSLPQLVHAVLSHPFPPPQKLGIDVPAALTEVLERALAKERDQRFTTVAELAAALVPFAAVEQEAGQCALRVLAVSSSGTLPPHAIPTADAGHAQRAVRDTAPPPAAPRQWPSRLALAWGSLALTLVLGCGLLLYGWARILSAPAAQPERAGQEASTIATIPRVPSSVPAPARSAEERAAPAEPPAEPPRTPDVAPEAAPEGAESTSPVSDPSAQPEALSKNGEALPPLRPHAPVPPLPHDEPPQERASPDALEPAHDEPAQAPGAAAPAPVPLRVTDFGGRH